MIFSFALFILIFLVATNYFQLVTFASLIVGPKIKTSIIIDKWILNTIKVKTGLVLRNLTIFHDQRPYAMMGGIYPFPMLIISEKMHKAFNRDELEWVILHEAGHHLLWHNLKAIVIEIGMIVIGIRLVSLFQLNIFLAAILSLLFSLLTVQIIRYTIEYSADKFSIKRVTNPQAVITAQAKLQKFYKTDFYRLFLGWNVSSNLRIKMAKSRLKPSSIT